jgi:hypothetical protein
MSTQVTYTVSIIGEDLSPQYSGELMLQMDISPLGTTVSSGLLSLDSYPPLLLSSVSGVPFWSLSGSNGKVNVSTSWFYPTVLSGQSLPTRIAGFVVISVGGGAEQTLPILGFDAAQAPQAEALGAASDSSAEWLAPASLSAGAAGDNYNYKLTLLDNSFGQAGGGQLKATGVWMKIGPVARTYYVTGTLQLDDPAVSMSVSGYGSSSFWTVRGSSGDTSAQLSIVVGVSGTGVSDGNLTLGGTQQSFVVTGPLSD